MVSLRKRPSDIEDTVAPEAPPPVVAEPPPPAAETPTPVAEPKESDPVQTAASNAIKQRLAEMEAAEGRQREILQQRIAAEPQQPQAQPTPEEYLEQAIANLPKRVQSWYRRDPQLFFNPKRAAQIQYTHHVVADEVGEGSDEYLNRMEALLFSRPETKTNGSGNGQHPVRSAPVQERRQPAPAQREAAPTYSHSMPPAAPPSRDIPLASTGRRDEPMRLTQEEIEYAQLSGVSPEVYLQGKKKLLRRKAAGLDQE
jgi:hypothetical protein